MAPASPEDRNKMRRQDQFDGFIKDDGRILVRPEAWRRLWAGLDAEDVKKQLIRAILLIADRNGRNPSSERYVNSGGKSERDWFYILASAFVTT